MISSQQLVAALRHEVAVIKHLAAKLDPAAYDWRPSPDQRSTLELMRYLTITGLNAALHNVNGNWEHAERLSAEAETVTPANFGEAMDREMQRIDEVIASVDLEKAKTVPTVTFWGAPTTQAAGFIEGTLKVFVAYRMQLFLYVKQSGSPEVAGADCWAGRDTRRPN